MPTFKTSISFLFVLAIFWFTSSNNVTAQNMHMGVWGNEKGTDLFWKNAPLDNFTTKYKEFVAQGHYLHDVETYTKNGKRLFAGMFRKAKPVASSPTGAINGRGGQSGGNSANPAIGASGVQTKANFLLVAKGWDFLMKKYNELIRQGLRLKDIETWSENGIQHYIGVFEEGSGGHGIWGGSDWDAFLKTWNDMAAKNTRLIDIERFEENGQKHYIGVYREGPGKEQAIWAHVEWENFSQQRKKLQDSGYALIDMETYLKNGKRLYIGLYHTATQKNIFNFRLTEKSFHEKWVNIAEAYSVHIQDFDVYEGIDFEQIAKTLNNGLKDKCIGYGYAIYKNGIMKKSGSGGNRIMPQDGGPKKFNPHTVKGIHSMTKTMTAIAVLQLINKTPGLSVESKIHPYLPSYWSIHDSFKDITFKQLLTHNAGLTGTHDGYNEMKSLAFNGKNGPDNYANVNFTLFRIIIPYLYQPQKMKDIENLPLPEFMKDKNMAIATADTYVEYMKQYVFNPAGAYNAGTAPYGEVAYTYDFKNPSKKGKVPYDPKMIAGAGALHMNVIDINKVLAAWDSGRLLPLDKVQQMKSERLGIQTRGGANGTYYTHSGGTSYGRSDMMVFPNNITIAIQVNSVGNSYQDTEIQMQQAYDNAYIK